MSGAKASAWSVCILICVLIPVILFLDAGAGEYKAPWHDNVFGVIATLASTGVGLVLAARRPHNPIGWLLLANGVAITIGGLAPAWAGYALNHPGTLPGPRVLAVWDTTGWPILFAPIVAIAFVFPDGRLPSRRWRPAVALGIISFTSMLMGGLLSSDTLDVPFDEVEPLAVLPAAVSGTMQGLGLLGMIATLVLAMVALVSRFRGAEGELREQMKWIAYAAALIPISIIVGSLDPVEAAPGLATNLALIAVEIAIPVAIGIAVMRYRLYEIDRLINATLVYGALTALLAAAFITVTLVAGVAVGGGSALPTAAATLAVALAFRPLRDQVQTLVDRRFNRSRYDALQKVGRFMEDLRLGHAEPEAIGRVIAEAVSDPGLRLYFWLPDDAVHADADGRVAAELPTAPAGMTPVSRGALKLGTIVHDPKLLEPPGLLNSVVLRAGLAIEIARLRVEVRRRLSEVEASRARIVAATYEERRRLERDLHDGAQQRLISLGLDLRHVQHRIDDGDGDARAALDGVVAGLGDAVAELRELARGVRPAALDGGLAPALQELAARAPVPTELQVTDERFGEKLEAAAYFVASEALTNAVKHAGGSLVMLRADRSNGTLVLTVSDDGRGGAVAEPNSGLNGLYDRVAALGGRLELRSEAGHGTSLIAEFPCE